MDGDALPQIELVCNLGGLLELKSCLKSRWQPWLGGPLYKFIWIRQTFYIGTYSLASLHLNYFVHGNHSKTTAGPECSSVHNYGCTLAHPCSISATMWAALFTGGFWIWFKVLVVTSKTLHGSRTEYLRDHLSPIIFTHPKKSDRFSIFQVLSIKQWHLPGLRTCDFYVAEPACWNSTSPAPRIWIVLTMLAFRKAPKIGSSLEHCAKFNF